MSPQLIKALLIAIVILAALLVFSVIIYYHRLINNLFVILRKFQENGSVEDYDVKETMESKLISQLKRVLVTANAKQEKALNEKAQVTALLSDLSHQLKTPLANIVMHTELLQEIGLSRQEQQKFILQTKQQAEKMQWLMKTLLKASRLEQGIISFESSQCMIKETIAMGISAVFAQAQKKQIVIETMEFVDHSLYHNPKWTAEVLTNILENAVKYSPQGSVVRIELTPLDIYTKIDIKDEGMGIPREEYNMIFRRFYRGKKAELKEGTGLGLYLAQLIMQKELGYITLTSSDGKGSCFSLFLLQNKTKNLNLCKKQGRH